MGATMMAGKTPSMLRQQPQYVKDKIIEMAQTELYDDIVKWLNAQDIPANWNQVRYFIATHNSIPKPQPIAPVKGYSAKARVYIGALLEYDADTYTTNNLHLYGTSWSVITVKLHRAGLIEPIRKYSPMRWRILATKAELRGWMVKEKQKS